MLIFNGIVNRVSSSQLIFITMSELFFEGYSEYELEAMKIPTEGKHKCLKKQVDLTLCYQKAGYFRNMFQGACQDEQSRFDRCHQKSVNYYTAATVGNMLYANPSAFREKNVSPTYQTFFAVPTPLHVER